ncbi:TetR family transcriptional regulator C-terminal domain-containing protein [Nocardia blacklockiae]|uniref:TetR family transcriptional regulator C-terminal domain-containing protein n=1 Tax=Nocardia blacklockiae TaxID=480036 RepID=UPI0018936760|nr:TetR family transcriptional regulator C-terminal domain-containing protein [Nocardia blacklockiae]MBF6173117.1 TetR family transcriptional regulator [Nocardia blacklockiae]
MTKRRAKTRQRLLDAAFEAFADEGFGRCTVEQICERAGFTRGAFYSNFTSLEELFLAMWEQRSSRLLHEMTAVLEDQAEPPTGLRADVESTTAPTNLRTNAEDETAPAHLRTNPEGTATPAYLRANVERVLAAVPLDEKWFRITFEFTAHALRNPALRRVMAAREQAIDAALRPVLTELLARAGRTIPDPAALGRALVAVHDGTATQCLMEPDSAAARQQRIDLFTHVVLAYSEAREQHS